VTEVADMHCATSWTAVGIEWHGVRARDVVAMAPPAADAVGALVFAEFGYAANIRVTDLDDALLATHRDGVPLSAERGGPLRLVIPHLYTWKGPKWLRGWNYLRAEDPDRGFWEQRGYHSHGEAWAEQRWEVRPPSAR
jgi:DMSO/TMAO reductase YedYZ molybdopterin-dependent catalytic subunit